MVNNPAFLLKRGVFLSVALAWREKQDRILGTGGLSWCQTWTNCRARAEVGRCDPAGGSRRPLFGRGCPPAGSSARGRRLSILIALAGRTGNSFNPFVKRLREDGSALIGGESFVLVLIKSLSLWLPNLLLNNSFTFPFPVLRVFKKLCWR